jgi:fatty acid desaturase
LTAERIPGTLNLVLLAGASGLATALLWLASHAGGTTVLLAALAFSYLNNTVFSLLHESVHSVFHENNRVNEAAGILAAAMIPTGLSFQRAFHLSHHARNRTADEQFDYFRPGDSRLLKRAQWYCILSGVYWVFLPLGCMVYLLAPWLFRLPVFRARDGAFAQQTGAAAMFARLDRGSRTRLRLEIVCAIVCQCALISLLDLSLAGWIACYAAFAVNWSSLQYADHAFSPLDVRNGAWNLRVNRMVQWLFLNYHHHLAHHQHPSVPWIHLPRYVNFNASRPSFLSVYLSMWRGPRPLPPSPLRDAGDTP